MCNGNVKRRSGVLEKYTPSREGCDGSSTPLMVRRSSTSVSQEPPNRLARMIDSPVGPSAHRPQPSDQSRLQEGRCEDAPE